MPLFDMTYKRLPVAQWLPFLLEGEFFNDSPSLLKKEAIKLLFYMSSLPINSASNNTFTMIR